MLHLALVLLLAAPFQGKEPAPVDPAKKQTAIAELTRAFDKEGGPEARVGAIERCRELVDAEVIALVKKGLEDKDERVIEAAVTALGRMDHKHSLDALHVYLRKEKKKLAENDKLFPIVIKEIGRHGAESSLALIADDAFDQRAYATAQARIMAIGNIRSVKSIEALIDLSKKVGVHRMDGLRQDMRLALARLTGRDLGANSTQWVAWWQDNKKSFEMSEAAPKLEPAMERQWSRYWSLGDEAEGEEGGGGGSNGGGRRRRGEGGDGKGGDGKGGDDRGGEGKGGDEKGGDEKRSGGSRG